MLSRSLKSCDSSNGQILIFVPDNPLQSMTLICGRGGGFRARIPLLPRARTRHDFSKTALVCQTVTHDAPECGEAIAPTDFLAFGVGAS